jgi:aldose 1-epimerase
LANADHFGTLPDGSTVHRLAISGGGLTANILTWGAIVQELRLSGHPAPLTLGFERLDDYVDHSLYFGAIVGRYANRIAGGRFSIDGEKFEAEGNDRGNSLHGGSKGLDRRNWSIAEHGSDFVTLTAQEPSGWMGFPGTLDVACTYSLRAGGVLSVELSASCDRPTLCNLAHHSYFNLDDGGRGSILDHRMSLPASAYTPVDDNLLPTGAVLPVEGTDFDFVLPRTIRARTGEDTAYDHNWCLAAARGPVRQVCWVQGASSGVEMEVWSTEPGLQFFTGQFPDRAVPGLEGVTYRRFAGFCLEPQVWPDSPNHPHFPQAVLRPGEQYRQSTEYRFRLPQET